MGNDNLMNKYALALAERAMTTSSQISGRGRKEGETE